MSRLHRYRFFEACLLLLILLAAQTGQKVHIYMEDPLHFPAFAADLLPDNGAHERIVERCVVDDYDFFPFIEAAANIHTFYRSAVGVVRIAAMRCKHVSVKRTLSLRGPPAGCIHPRFSPPSRWRF